MTWLFEPFHFEFMQRAMLATLMVGFTCGFLSCFIVLRNLSLTIDSMSHALLPGLALSVILFGIGPLSLFAGGLAAALLVGLGGEIIHRSSRVRHDAAVGILCALSFSVGVILVYAFQDKVRVDITHYLFGNILGVSDSDLWVQYGMMMLIIPTLLLFQRPVFLAIFDPEVAASQGVPTRLIHYVLVVFLVLAVIASLQAVGLVLSIGLLIAPAATVYLFSNSVKVLMWGGAVVGTVSSGVGLWASYYLEVPAGPCMVFVISGVFLLSVVFSPRYGLIRRIFRKKHLHEQSLERWGQKLSEKR